MNCRKRLDTYGGEDAELDPFRCRMWAFHDRLEDYVTEDTCKAEIESFLRQGQIVPVLGRRVPGNPNFDFELIFGARRLFVARHVNARLRVRVVTLSDQQALIAMDIENRQRKDISPYERSLSFARWLKAGLFESQDQLARALRVSSAQVSRLLRLSRLPPVVLNAFERPIDIMEGWGVDLANAWENPSTRPSLVQRARAIAALPSRPSPESIYEQLIAISARQSRRKPSEAVLDNQRRPLFRVRRLRGSIELSLPMSVITPEVLEEIKASVKLILISARTRDALTAITKVARYPGRRMIPLVTVNTRAGGQDAEHHG